VRGQEIMLFMPNSVCSHEAINCGPEINHIMGKVFQEDLDEREIKAESVSWQVKSVLFLVKDFTYQD